jgi:hypothetical protein
MNHRLDSRFAVCLSTFVALAAFACSSAPPETGSEKPSSEKAPSNKKADDKNATSDTSKNDPEPSKPLSDTSACGQKATAQECGDCCLAKTPTALDASDKIFGDCMCAAATCETVCSASACAAADNQNQPTAACETCLKTNGQACEDKAKAACDADAECKAADACLATSCAALEQKEGAAGGNGGAAMRTTLSARAALASARQR